MKVGAIVQVKSFCEYVVKVPLEADDGYVPVSRIPAGAYVSIRSNDGYVVGIVTDVRHSIKEDYLPFLSQEKQDIFMPYASDYRSSYLVIRGIGNEHEGTVAQSLTFAPEVNDPVQTMEKDDIKNFHMQDGRPNFSYYKKISMSVDAAAICGAIDMLAESMPECKQMLKALKKHTEAKI